MRRPLMAFVMASAFAFALFGLPVHQTRDRLEWDRTTRQVDKLIAAGRFIEALPLVTDARERRPRDIGALRQLAHVFAGLRRPSDEAAVLEAILAEAPATDDVCLRLSSVYAHLGDPARVVATVERCLAFDAHQRELLRDREAALRPRSGQALEDEP